MPINVLLVEDNPADVRLIAEMLRQGGGKEVTFKHAGSLSAALESLQSEKPDCVVLDLTLPDSRGLATFQRLQGEAAGVPIVVLSGLDDIEVAVEAIADGASDYLVKNDLSSGLLLRALRYGLERKRMEAALQETQRELALRHKLANILLTIPDQQMFAEVLDTLLEATRSEHGFFGYIDEGGALVCPSTRGVWDPSQVPEKPTPFPCEIGDGVWVRSLVEKRALYSNEPGHAARHVSFRRVLAVPLVDQKEAIGLVAVANRDFDYDENDRAFLERVAVYLTPVLKARLQRDAHERALSVALTGKVVLLQEVHHRVKNNLQLICSLLNLQSANAPEEARRALEESHHRVYSMALVHEKLYRTDHPDRLDFGEYAAALVHNLFAAFSDPNDAVRLRSELDRVLIETDQAVPCALILNELVTNAVKHGFPEGGGGEVLVEVHEQADGGVMLRVKDNGVGLPAGLDWKQSKSLGLRIASTLTAQLGGNLESIPGDGADFVLHFIRR
jgi:two-component sensor histidine kinase/CheY-like chemotaxis protein